MDLHSLEFLVSGESFGRNFGYLVLFQTTNNSVRIKQKTKIISQLI